MSLNNKIYHHKFSTDTGSEEHFFTIQAPASLEFREQVRYIEDSYLIKLRECGLASETSVFRRIFLSDALNQSGFVRESWLADDDTAVSIVQQPPLQESKIALFAYHTKDPKVLTKNRLSSKHILMHQGGQRHLWSTRLCACDRDMTNSSGIQTRLIFDELIAALISRNANLYEHCVRTWVYMKDVDVFYKGMVDSRRALFVDNGLTADTHYIASTGIEGACSHQHDLVSMDAYSNLDLLPGQTTYLNNFEYLCATKDYQVTFERGTRIAYRDRAHFFISGTASIDKAGNVLHPGSVLQQMDRALENTDALLRSGGGTLQDMMYLFVYVRDIADFGRVNKSLRSRFPHLPILILQGSVCRPDWLIEIEGIAITKNDQPDLPTY